MRLSISFAFIFWIFSNVFAQDCQSSFNPKKELPAKTFLCPQTMQADLAQLHKHILETHPNPTYYGNLNDLSLAYASAQQKIKQPLTVFEFILVVNSYLFTLKDSHTGLNPKQFLYNVNANRKVLPFFVEPVGNQFIISGAYNSDFIIGAELLAIDSFTVQQLYDYGLALSLSEGDSEAAKAEVASEYIGIVYNLLSMDFKPSKRAKVKLVTVKGDTLTKEIDFSPSWKYFLSSLFNNSEDELSYSFDENNQGILVVESFQPLSLNLYKKQIDAFFEEVRQRNCTTIFIDLRNNLGGLFEGRRISF